MRSWQIRCFSVKVIYILRYVCAKRLNYLSLNVISFFTECALLAFKYIPWNLFLILLLQSCRLETVNTFQLPSPAFENFSWQSSQFLLSVYILSVFTYWCTFYYGDIYRLLSVLSKSEYTPSMYLVFNCFLKSIWMSFHSSIAFQKYVLRILSGSNILERSGCWELFRGVQRTQNLRNSIGAVFC